MKYNDNIEFLLDGLIEYAMNLSTYRFYITQEMLDRFVGCTSIDELSEIQGKGLLEYRNGDKVKGLIWIKLDMPKISETYPNVSNDDLRRLYVKSDGSRGLKSSKNLIKLVDEREAKSYYLVQNAEKNYLKRTFTEKCFSEYLSNHNSCFWEQVPIITGEGKCYILDFLVHQTTCIELDGEYHKNRKSKDDVRDIELEKFGIKTIRYTNDEIAKIINLEMII